MVKVGLLLLAIPCCLYSDPPKGWNEETAVKQLINDKTLKELNYMSSENINKVLKEHGIQLPPEVVRVQYGELKPDEKRDIFQSAHVTLTKEQIEGQWGSITDVERENLLKLFLEKKDPVQRQSLIDGLITIPTVDMVLEKKECKPIATHFNPTYVGVIPVVEWINLSHFTSYFQPTMTESFVNREQFNDFNSFNQWGLWIEPYGFGTQFKHNVHFDLNSLGLSLGGEVTLYDRLVLGVGASYSHSSVSLPKETLDTEVIKENDARWKSTHSTSAVINTLYLGPYLGYVFTHGYLGLNLIGAGNFYDMTRKDTLDGSIKDSSISLLTHSRSIENTSWDLLARLEGGLAYSPDDCFFFYPTFRVDYLNVFEQASTDMFEIEEEEKEIKIDSLHASFLTSKVGLKISREFFLSQQGYLIPTLSGGLLHFTTLTTPSYHFEVDTCSDLHGKLSPGSWNQYYIGAGFTLIHKRGILVGLDYEATFGADSPAQYGSLRFEFSW